MKKKIVAFCMAMLVFAGSSMTTLAAICPNPNAPEGIHHFNDHKRAGWGYERDLGTHSYVYARDSQGNPMYRDDCRVKTSFEYCQYVCHYCGLANQETELHDHYVGVTHSVNHN